MASAQNSNHMRSNYAARTYVHDPADASAAAVVAYVPIATFSHFLALLVVLANAVVTFRIMAAEDEAGTGAVEVKAHGTPTVADAVGDQLVLECAMEELPALGANLKYIGVEVDMNNSNGQAAVTYVRKASRFAFDGLTADVIAP